jgi:Fe-S-cluster containining protein
VIISKKTPREIVLKLGDSCDSKRCEGHNHCCSYSAGFLAGDDLQKMAKHLNVSVPELKVKYLDEKRIFNTQTYKPKSVKAQGKQYGPCIFLNTDKGCLIHAVKPTQCRISSCKEYGYDLMQWFYLNHMVNPDDPQSMREYAEFLKSNTPIPGGSLEELVPDKEKLAKMLSYEKFRKEE